MIYALLFLILICIGLGLLASRQSQALDDLSDKYLDAEERAEDSGLDPYGYDDEGNKYGERPFQEIGDEDGELPF